MVICLHLKIVLLYSIKTVVSHLNAILHYDCNVFTKKRRNRRVNRYVKEVGRERVKETSRNDANGATLD